MVQDRGWIQAATVFLFAMLVGYFYYVGLICSDDTRYLFGSIKLGIGEPVSVDSLAERRLIFLIPGALVHALSGEVELSIIAYGAFFIGLGLVMLLIARRLFSPWLAVACALVTLAQPSLFLYSGALLPDLPAAFMLSLALYGLCGWVQSAVDGERSVAVRYAAMTGIAASLAFAIKESSAIVLVVPLALMALRLLRRRDGAPMEALAFVAGFGSMLLLEACTFRIFAGQWYSSIASLLSPHDFSGYAELQGSAPIERLRLLGNLLGPQTSVLFALATISFVWLLADAYRGRVAAREGAVYAMIAVLWAWPLLYFTYGTGSYNEYVLPVMQQRYYALCIGPAVLLAARLWTRIALFRIASPVWHRLWHGVGTAGLILLLSAPYVDRHQRGLIYGARGKEAFELALVDAQRRFPGIAVIDSDAGWTTDLRRCRVLMQAGDTRGQSRLIESILARKDRRGDFDYPDVAALQPPFLVIGHGPMFAPGTPQTKWVEQMARRLRDDGLPVTQVGRYSLRQRRSLRGLWWLPRQYAVRRSLENETSSVETLETDYDDYRLVWTTELHLVLPAP